MYPTHLNTLFVLNETARVKKDGQALVVEAEDGKRTTVPTHAIESMVCLESVWVSPPALGLCLEHAITVTFIAYNGRHCASLVGKPHGSVLTRHEQMKLAMDSAATLGIARDIVLAKMHNTRQVIQRFARDHSASETEIGSDGTSGAIHEIRRLMSAVPTTQSLDELRGFEGSVAAQYFGTFGLLLTRHEDKWEWNGRRKHPSIDPVNALLSFLYALLRHDCESAATGAGLDTEVGFLHSLRSGRPSLALDLMEPFRSILADRVALDLLNRRQIKPSHFETHPSHAVTMTDSARRLVVQAWQAKKQEEIVHPILKEKMPWKLCLHMEARLMSRFIREGGEHFPAFRYS